MNGSRWLRAQWRQLSSLVAGARLRGSSPDCLTAINSGDQINLLAARARFQGVAELQLGEGQHLVGREPGGPTGRILPLNLAVDRRDPRIVLSHLAGAFQAE